MASTITFHKKPNCLFINRGNCIIYLLSLALILPLDL